MDPLLATGVTADQLVGCPVAAELSTLQERAEGIPFLSDKAKTKKPISQNSWYMFKHIRRPTLLLTLSLSIYAKSMDTYKIFKYIN